LFSQCLSFFPFFGLFARWWSQYNQYRQILRLWSGIGQWLHDEQELDNSSLSALRQMLDDANMSGLIYLQLNVAFHFCKAWVEFTFKFEGDSFQADLVHDALTNLLELAGGIGLKYFSFVS